jgi:hypothetical protein
MLTRCPLRSPIRQGTLDISIRTGVGYSIPRSVTSVISTTDHDPDLKRCEARLESTS